MLNKYEVLYVNIIGALTRYIHFLPLPCVATTSPSSPPSPPSLATAASLRRSAVDDVFELVVQDPAAAVHYEYNDIRTMNEGAGTFPSCATQTSRHYKPVALPLPLFSIAIQTLNVGLLLLASFRLFRRS